MNNKLDFLNIGFLGRKKKSGPDPKYATFNRRMLAATIDSVIGMVTVAPVLDYFFNRFMPLPEVDWYAIQHKIPAGATDQEANRIIVDALISTGYLAARVDNFFWQTIALSIVTGICWHFWSATPGKILLRMRVVDARTESHISDAQIIMRLLGYIISTLCLCIGFFWIGVDKRRQAWHDKLAETVVIVVPKKVKSISGSEVADPSDSPAPSKAE